MYRISMFVLCVFALLLAVAPAQSCDQVLGFNAGCYQQQAVFVQPVYRQQVVAFRQAAFVQPQFVSGGQSIQNVTVNRSGLFGRRTSVNVQQISGGGIGAGNVQSVRIRR